MDARDVCGEVTMSKLQDYVQIQTVSGDAAVAGDVKLIPQSRSLTVRCTYGGMVWHRPVAVLVQRDGQEEAIPIVDVTRIAQLGFWGLSVLFALIAWTVSLRQNKEGLG